MTQCFPSTYGWHGIKGISCQLLVWTTSGGKSSCLFSVDSMFIQQFSLFSDSFSDPFNHSFCCFIQQSMQWFIQQLLLFIDLVVQSMIRSAVYSTVHAMVHSMVHSTAPFIHWFNGPFSGSFSCLFNSWFNSSLNDSLPARGPGGRLVPDMQTPAGQSVQAMREQLNMVPVDIITYGVVFHPHLSTSGCRMPTAVQRSMQG